MSESDYIRAIKQNPRLLNLGVLTEAQEWAHERLLNSGHHWHLKAKKLGRRFDFWNYQMGIGIMVNERPITQGELAQDELLSLQAFLILRVRAFDEDAMRAVVERVREALPWRARVDGTEWQPALMHQSGERRYDGTEEPESGRA